MKAGSLVRLDSMWLLLDRRAIRRGLGVVVEVGCNASPFHSRVRVYWPNRDVQWFLIEDLEEVVT